MNGRGGCCIARYSNGGSVYGYETSQVNRIMLRFRPIAPKPVTIGDPASNIAEKSPSQVRAKTGGRGKRKSGLAPARRSNTKKGKSSSSSPEIQTLPLLPEKPEPKITLNPNPSPNSLSPRMTSQSSDRTVGIVSSGLVIGSSVTVECVTDTWTNGDGLGRTDRERRENLERDTCPGFFSDGFGRVTWTNEAYGKMVGGFGGIEVWLVMKEKLPAADVAAFPAFTCRVRIQRHVDGGDHRVGSAKVATMPCDVWRLDSGGYAWRLDVKAALCLGR